NRIMKKITAIAGATGTRLRDRSRSVKLRVLEIARVARAKGPINQEKLKQRYHQLLETTSRVVGQAKRFSNEVAEGVKRSADMLQQLALDGLRQQLDTMLPRVRHVMRQTRERIYHGKTRTQGKILSLFEPATEVIRKGKAGKPNEFGNMVKLQEAESTAPGRGGRRLLFRQERRGGEGDGRQARVHSQSLQQKPRAQTRAEEALVPQWAKMADRMRGVHQRGQAATRSRSLPLQRLRRNEPLGWPRHYRRQRRQHRPRDRKAIKAVSSPSPLKLSNRTPVTPAGIALRLSIDRRSPKRNFAPGSRLEALVVIPAPRAIGTVAENVIRPLAQSDVVHERQARVSIRLPQ